MSEPVTVVVSSESLTTVVGVQGPPGPTGPQGAEGPVGPAGVSATLRDFDVLNVLAPYARTDQEQAFGLTQRFDAPLKLRTGTTYATTGAADLVRHVEAATGGLCTVRYAGGLAQYVRRIPVIRYEDFGSAYSTALGTGVLEAFYRADGSIAPWIEIGMFTAGNVGGVAASQPGLAPWGGQTWPAAKAKAEALGANWRLLSVWDWALLWMLCTASSYTPGGNTAYGRNASATWQVGRRTDAGTPGTTTGTPSTLSGSGPVQWRHDGTLAGIADLLGNVTKWIDGVKYVSGSVYLAPSNQYLGDEDDWGDESWALTNNVQFSTINGATASQKIKRALLATSAGLTAPAGNVYSASTSTRMLSRGGSWTSGSGAGFGALIASSDKSTAQASAGFIPVYVPGDGE